MGFEVLLAAWDNKKVEKQKTGSMQLNNKSNSNIES
jgi:hypothetical protein